MSIFMSNIPCVKETAFSCPHCGAYTTQYWHNGYVKFIRDDPKIPSLPDAEFEKTIRALKDVEEEAKRKFIDYSTNSEPSFYFPATRLRLKPFHV